MQSSRLLATTCIVVLWELALPLPSSVAAEIFHDDFEELDLGKWECSERCVQGQTCFAGCPQVAAGLVTFKHHTHNSDHAEDYCLSQEICTRETFFPTDELIVEARIRVRAPVGNGLVAAFFMYMDKLAPLPGYPDARASDEIDFEFLTNQINRSRDYHDPEGERRSLDPVFLAVYDNFQGAWDLPPYNWSSNAFVRRLDLTEWNTFRMHWRCGHVDWYWSPPEEADRLLASSVQVVPNEPMEVCFSFWAATEIWPEAWDSNLGPAADPGDDVVCYYEVDYVTVWDEPAAPGDMDIDGDVDLDDCRIFVCCMTGPALTASPPACCRGDFDGDADVDLRDFARLQMASPE
jgi:hypothetical protein